MIDVQILYNQYKNDEISIEMYHHSLTHSPTHSLTHSLKWTRLKMDSGSRSGGGGSWSGGGGGGGGERGRIPVVDELFEIQLGQEFNRIAILT